MYGHTPTSLMNNQEVLLMRQDFERMIKGPEAVVVTLECRVYSVNSVPEIDPVYKKDIRDTLPDPVTRSARCLQRIVNEDDVDLMRAESVKAGDCIFYFSITLQMAILFPRMKRESLVIIDKTGKRWVPVLKRAESISALQVATHGTIHVSQPVACRPEAR